MVPVLDELTDYAMPSNYGDDFANFAASKADAVMTSKALRSAVGASPAGTLQLKFCSVHHISEGFGFLGYYLFRNVGGG